MKCKKCNTEVPVGSRFCPGCGYEIDSVGGYPRRNDNKMTSGILIGVLVTVVVVLCIAVVYILLRPSEKEAASVSPEKTEVSQATEAASKDVQKDTVVVEKRIIVEQQVKETPIKPSPNYTEGVGVWPFTSTRKLTYSDVAGLTAWELKIMRNEIYARHGYIFKTAEMKDYFRRQPWYSPVSSSVRLSKTEEYNVAFIKRYE